MRLLSSIVNNHKETTLATQATAPVRAVPAQTSPDQQTTWRLLRAHIKVIGDTVDPETGEPGPKLDAKKPLQITGVANANIVDRVNEVLDPRGAVLVNYLKNPQILYNHDYSRPIGSATSVEIKEDGLHFAADIGRPDLAPLTEDQDKVRSLVAQGILQTVSVGFIPLEYQSAEYDDSGELLKAAVYTRWELLEISVVSVPCNSDSIFAMKELAMTTKPTKEAPAADPASGDEPPGAAGPMLKAIGEACAKACQGIADLHTKMDALHGKVDTIKGPAAAADTVEPDADDAAKALAARLDLLEAGIKSLTEALTATVTALKSKGAL